MLHLSRVVLYMLCVRLKGSLIGLRCEISEIEGAKKTGNPLTNILLLLNRNHTRKDIVIIQI